MAHLCNDIKIVVLTILQKGDKNDDIQARISSSI